VGELTIDIGADRKRTANVVRSEVVRERIEDHLMRSGGRISRDRYEVAREDFLSTALRAAERAGMRSWTGPDKHAIRASAKGSLQVLFGEKVNVTPGKGGSGAKNRTGVNVSWVLDVWENALNVINRQDPAHRENDEHTYLRAGARFDEPYVEPADGPQVIKIVKSLSTRVIDAYLGRDDEEMLRLALEIEDLETVA
jgi:hypothetical protein